MSPPHSLPLRSFLRPCLPAASPCALPVPTITHPNDAVLLRHLSPPPSSTFHPNRTRSFETSATHITVRFYGQSVKSVTSFNILQLSNPSLSSAATWCFFGAA